MILSEGLKSYQTIIDDLELHFVCKYVPNSTEVLLFFHGLACTYDSFKHILDKDYFPDKSFLFVDHVGFGESSKPVNFSYSMKDQAKIIDELLKSMPSWRIHIIAHSMGAAIALLLCNETYKKVKSFANVEGNLIAEDCGIMSRAISEKSYEEYENGLYKMHLFAFGKHEQLRFRQSTPFAIYNSALSLVNESDNGALLEKFEKLDCKKAYFYGDENKDMPILKRLHSIELQEIADSGHAMTLQNPTEFYPKLVNFISF